MGMQAYAPNGKRIVGTLELVPGTAGISEGTWERDPAGGFKFEYDGETKMCWDAQETITRGGQAVYEDEIGCEWLENQLELREVPDGQ